MRARLLWRQFQDVYFLDTIYRQQGDEHETFRAILQRLSKGESLEGDWHAMMARRPALLSREDNTRFSDGVHLFGQNQKVTELNLRQLERLAVPVLESKSLPAYGQANIEDDESTERLPSVLIAVGARVMLRKNLWVQKGISLPFYFLFLS